MNHSLLVQSRLFGRIREQVPVHLSLVDEVAAALGISTDSAYRRLRGETALTLDEAAKLSGHFRIPIYDLFEQPDDTVHFKRVVINDAAQGFENYLHYSKAFFDKIAAGKNKFGIYPAKDIPVFYYFLFPDLARFKLFLWLKTSNEGSSLANQGFSMSIIPDLFVDLGAEITKTFMRIPFIEIWNEDTISSTIGQIVYYYEAELFDHPGDARHLLNQVEAMIQHIEEQAKKGVKLYNGQEQASYQLYINEILVPGNTILFDVDGLLSTVFSYNAMDYLHTADTRFCAQVHQWLRVQLEKSSLISRVSEKERNRFFHKIYHRIEDSRRKLR